MKIVIFDPNSTMIPQIGVMIDEAIAALELGAEVTFITCGGCMDSCYSNPLMNNVFCQICINQYDDFINKHLGPKVSHKKLNEFMDSNIELELQNYNYDFISVEDLKRKEFKGIDVGYAALSSFISNTRNPNPVLNETTRKVLTKNLKTAVRMSLLAERIRNQESPQKLIIYNGRMPESRPLLKFFLANEIPVDINEVYPTDLNGGFKKITYHNALPHSIAYFQHRINEEWNKNEKKARELGLKFFQNRRDASFSGDKVYIKDQKEGLLPESWNHSARNIVIFNSSEDEFAAIGAEWENKLFRSQMQGIQHIFNCIVEHPNCDIYLRIHPNLKDIKYSYHTGLYHLSKHPRVHIIPGDSKISTYALVDAANVVVSFGTSVGVEAAHANKPVVLLGSSFYKGLGICYEPETIKEAEELIFTQNLMPLKNDNILKYGNFIMCEKGKNYAFYNFNCTQIRLGKFKTPNVAMIDQSHTTYDYFLSFFMRVWRFTQRIYLKIKIPEA